MTEGNPLFRIVCFAVPLLLGNCFQILYTTVDSIAAGRLIGSDALAAIGAASPAADLLLGLVIGMANGISIGIAQKIGSSGKKKASSACGAGLVLMAFTGIAVTAAGIAAGKTLLAAMHVSDELMEGAYLYISVLYSGALFSAAYNYEAAVLRAAGDSVTPLLFLMLSAVLNIAGDLFFVTVLHAGVAGIAAATVGAQFICCIVCGLVMKKRNLFSGILRFQRSDLLFQLRIALPMAFFQSLLSVSFMIMQSGLNLLGNDEIAAYTAAYKADSLLMQILSGFGTAAATFTAQNIGKGDPARVKKGMRRTLAVTLTVSAAALIAAQLFARGFIMLFVSASESEVIAFGIRCVTFTSRFYPVLGINFTVRFVLTGAGRSEVPLGVGILELLLRIAGTMFLIRPLGFDGAVWINPICWCVSTGMICFFYPYLMRRTGTENRIQEMESGPENGVLR